MSEVAQENQESQAEPTPLTESDEEQLALIDDSEQLESSTDDTEDEDQAAEEPKPAGRRDKRISQLTFEKYELERQKNAEIETLRQQLEQKQVAAPAQQEGKPTRAQFDYDDDQYFEALADWKADQKVNAFAASQAKQQQTAAESQAVESWNKKRQGYASEHPEYLDITTKRGQAVTSNAVAAYLTSSEIGPKMHHELLENFEQLQRIQMLPEWQQGAELAKLETKLSKVKTKQKSSAPAPVSTVGSSNSAGPKKQQSMPSNW